jgi:MFS family permease
MNEPLHPLRLGEILDRTAQIYRSRFLVFLGIATIPAGTIFVFFAGLFGLIAWIGPNANNGPATASVIVWAFVIILSLLIVPASLGTSALGEAAMCEAGARIFLGGTITIREAYRTAWNRGWRYVGLFVLQGLAIMVGPAVVLVIAFVVMITVKVSGYSTNDPSPLFGGLLFLVIAILCVFAVWMLLRLCLAFPAAVVEQTSAWNALKRGTRLSEGTKGRILLLYILGILLNQILTWVIAFPAVLMLALIPGLKGQAHVQILGILMMFVTYGAMFAVRAMTKPVYGIALTLFYFDQRIRKEGFDIEWMMRQAGMVGPGAPQENAPIPGDPASTCAGTQERREPPDFIEQNMVTANSEVEQKTASNPEGSNA